MVETVDGVRVVCFSPLVVKVEVIAIAVITKVFIGTEAAVAVLVTAIAVLIIFIVPFFLKVFRGS